MAGSPSSAQISTTETPLERNHSLASEPNTPGPMGETKVGKAPSAPAVRAAFAAGPPTSRSAESDTTFSLGPGYPLNSLDQIDGC